MEHKGGKRDGYEVDFSQAAGQSNVQTCKGDRINDNDERTKSAT